MIGQPTDIIPFDMNCKTFQAKKVSTKMTKSIALQLSVAPFSSTGCFNLFQLFVCFLVHCHSTVSVSFELYSAEKPLKIY